MKFKKNHVHWHIVFSSVRTSKLPTVRHNMQRYCYLSRTGAYNYYYRNSEDLYRYIGLMQTVLQCLFQ